MTTDAGNTSTKKREIKFRNYIPQEVHSKRQKSDTVPEAVAAASDVGNHDKASSSKNSTIQEDLLLKELELNSTDEIKIVPKKPNWDLKNQISKSLEKLQRRTQRAIVEILQEKLAEDEHRTDEEENDDEV